ncbi:MAG: glycosyltransferase [Candidatus Hydrogenedentales bacterium]
MNVLHLDEQRGWRGGEQQASWLLRGLANRGHQVAVSGRPHAQFVQDPHGGVSMARLPLPFRHELDFATGRRLAHFIQDWPAHIIHAHTSHTHAIACMAQRWARRGKVVVSRRIDFEPGHDPANRLKYRLPHHYIAVSERVREVLLAYGIPPQKVTRVYSSIDIARLNVAPADRSALGVPADAPLLVSAGALVGHKDHATLLRAFANVRETLPEARLLIAGEGELRGELETLRAGLLLEESVQFLGHREDVPALIRVANLYVSSSWSEGLGTSVLEALGCETPVVATVAGGVGEMVIDGQTGRLAPNRDPEALAAAIIGALRDPEQARTWAAHGRARVEELFTVDRMVDGTIAVYERLLKP